MPKRIGLSLSGGGYRATAFHVGTLKKLRDLEKIDRVDVLSTISGGSIAGAAYITQKDDFDNFYKETIEKLVSKNLIREAFLTFPGAKFTVFAIIFLVLLIYFIWCGQPLYVFFTVLVFLVLLYFFHFSIFPVSQSIEKSYARYFTRKQNLGDLPEKPVLVLSSTNLQTARPFVFSKHFMGDSALTFAQTPVRFLPAGFPLARAVMASSCVPGAFSPVMVDPEFYEDPTLAEKNKPILADGGVYDNQGIHKVMQSGSFACDIIITSDAGNGLTREKSLRNSLQVAMRTMNVFMTRIKNVQMITDVYQNHEPGNKEIAYLSLGWNVENCIPGFVRNLKSKTIPDSLIAWHQLLPQWVADPDKYSTEICEHLANRIQYDRIDKPSPEELAAARSVGTNLTPLKRTDILALIKQAEALTEVQIKLYCPSL